ncbi:MAG: hypothetical protein ACLRH0_06915 [Blautia wexlerae]
MEKIVIENAVGAVRNMELADTNAMLQFIDQQRIFRKRAASRQQKHRTKSNRKTIPAIPPRW